MTIANDMRVLDRLASLNWRMKPSPKFTYEQLVSMDKKKWKIIGFSISQDEYFQCLYDGISFPEGLWIPPDWNTAVKKWDHKSQIIAEIGDDTWQEDLTYCRDESNWRVTLQ